MIERSATRPTWPAVSVGSRSSAIAIMRRIIERTSCARSIATAASEAKCATSRSSLSSKPRPPASPPDCPSTSAMQPRALSPARTIGTTSALPTWRPSACSVPIGGAVRPASAHWSGPSRVRSVVIATCPAIEFTSSGSVRPSTSVAPTISAARSMSPSTRKTTPEPAPASATASRRIRASRMSRSCTRASSPESSAMRSRRSRWVSASTTSSRLLSASRALAWSSSALRRARSRSARSSARKAWLRSRCARAASAWCTTRAMNSCGGGSFTR